MTGYRKIQEIREVEKLADEHGFRFGPPRHGFREMDVIALIPKDQDSLPIYNRDAELMIGTLEQIHCWLRGLTWAKNYYKMLGLVDDKKIHRKELNERNRQLMAMIKNSEQQS